MLKEIPRIKIVTRLTKLGVVIMADSAIENVFSDSVKLKTGQTIAGTAVVWTAGVQASRLSATIQGLPVTEKGKIIVNENLQITLPAGRQENHKNLFALGDCVEFINSKTHQPVPALAYHA